MLFDPLKNPTTFPRPQMCNQATNQAKHHYSQTDEQIRKADVGISRPKKVQNKRYESRKGIRQSESCNASSYTVQQRIGRFETQVIRFAKSEKRLKQTDAGYRCPRFNVDCLP